MEKESNQSCKGKTGAASSSSGKRPHGKAVAALLKRIRIHPEAQRILGNSCIPVVSLARLNFRSVCLSSLQPVVSLVRLPSQTQADDPGLGRPPQETGPRPRSPTFHPRRARGHVGLRLQDGVGHHEANTSEGAEVSPPADCGPPEETQTSWTEPYCPDSSPSGEPERDSGFDCDSNPDQTVILLDPGSDEWDPDGRTDSETFYLDPDPEQTLVIELDPEPGADQDGSLELEDEAEDKCEVVQLDDSEDERPDPCRSQEEEEEEEEKKEEEKEEEEEEEEDPSMQRPGPGPGPGSGAEETDSEDFCAACRNGGDLLCCDRCPKVYHLACHTPPLSSSPLGDWVCTLCRTDQDPAGPYECEDEASCRGVRAPYTLSHQDQRRCEKLTLLLYCHTLSAPFHEPVSILARNYYQIIKRPIDLSVIRRKLDQSNTLHYFTAEQFVDDVLLMFKNCATFNYPDSEWPRPVESLEMFFVSRLTEIFSDRTFPVDRLGPVGPRPPAVALQEEEGELQEEEICVQWEEILPVTKVLTTIHSTNAAAC